MKLPSIKRLFVEKYISWNPVDHRQSVEKAEDDFSDNRSVRVSFDEIASIYEAEYKIFRLSQESDRLGGSLPDQAYLEFYKLKTKLEELLPEIIFYLKYTIFAWMKHEEAIFMLGHYPTGEHTSLFRGEDDDKWPSDIAQEQLKKDVEQQIGRRYKSQYHDAEPQDPKDKEAWKVWEKLVEDYMDMAWDTKEPYKTVQEIYKDFKKGANDLKSSIVLFHKGLTAAHNTGTMAEYFLSKNDSRHYKSIDAVQFLNNLTNGRYTSKWDRDLERFIPKMESLYLKEVVSSRQPSPQEVIKAIQNLERK